MEEDGSQASENLHTCSFDQNLTSPRPSFINCEIELCAYVYMYSVTTDTQW